MYITRDLSQIRLNSFLLKRRIWSLFKKAWDKDATGYKKRCYFYKNGSVVNTEDFNRFIRAIGIKREDLTGMDYDGIESAWFYINKDEDPVTLLDLQSEVDGIQEGIEFTVDFNIGYKSGYLDAFTDVNGIIDTEAVISDVMADPLFHVLNDNVAFHQSDLLEAHILFDGTGFDIKSQYGHVIVNTSSDSPFVGVKAQITFVRNSTTITAQQRTIDILNGVLNLNTEYPTGTPDYDFATSQTYQSMISSWNPPSSTYLWTFSEFDSMTREAFINQFQNGFKTDYEEEDLEWYEVILLIIVLIVAVVLALPTGGFSAVTTLSALGTFLGSLTLYLSLATFVIAQTVGMGAIGLLRVFGKILEILGIATAILGIYAMLQRWTTVGLQSMMSVFKDAFKIMGTYDKLSSEDKDEEVAIEQTKKEDNQTFDHALNYMYTKSFETTEIEEKYQLMFDIDQYIHV